MAALASGASFPSSFQLRWGLQGRKSPPFHYFVRLRCPIRSRSMCIVCSDAMRDAGEGSEQHDSWSRSDSSSSSSEDSFSGWFGEDSDSGSSQGERRLGGIMGAGLAGIFLAAGIAFASLALSKKTTGVSKQAEPLTTEQEILLSTNDQTEKVDSVEENGSLPFSEERSSDSEVQGSMSRTKKVETVESSSDGRLDDNTSEKLSFIQKNELVGNIVVSHHEDLKTNMDAGLNPTTSRSNLISNESHLLESANAFSFKDSNSNVDSDKEDSAVEHSENTYTTDHVDLANVDTDSENLSTYHPGIFITDVSDKSKSSDEPSSQLICEPLGFKSSSSLEPTISLDNLSNFKNEQEPEIVSKEDDAKIDEDVQPITEDSQMFPLEVSTGVKIPSGTVLSSAFDQKEELQVLEETINLVLEGNPLSENGSSEAPTLSVLVSQSVNATGSYQHSPINTSQSIQESLLSETSFSHAGIPAPSVVSSALPIHPGKVLVPAVVDQVQEQALASLQVLKVIEDDVQPGDICTRREYARWLVSASSILSRSTTSKVYPAMYIENVTELAFNDVTPTDPDFSYIQGLAEAGLISSKLSRFGLNSSQDNDQAPLYFSPESPLSRQDLVSWKMALEKRQLPEVDKKIFLERSGYIDIDKINPEAWPAIVADLSSGENGIISLAFGYTRLFQPGKPVTKAQAAVVFLTGDAAEIVGEELTRVEAESVADTAVAVHTALVAEVEKDLNASFEKELVLEKEKIDAMEKLVQEARSELDKLKRVREEENNALVRGRATVESEMEILSKLRNEVEEQLQSLLSNKMGIAFERDHANKLRKEAENENQAIVQLQYELEVERKALAMARQWAEDEAKRAREQAKALEEAREWWEKEGIKVIIDEELRETASDGATWQSAGAQVTVEEIENRAKSPLEKLKSRSRSLFDEMKTRAENLVIKLRALLSEVKGKSAVVIERIIQRIMAIISTLKQQACRATQHATGVKDIFVSKASKSIQDSKDHATEFGSSIRGSTQRVIGDFRESVGKLTQKFKI